MEEIELFRCFLCSKYKPISQAKPVTVRGSTLPKDICDECFGKANAEGVYQTEKDLTEKKK
jgi:hypothetical protein